MPSALVELPSFPLTPNGKVDRRALPLPAVSAPRTVGRTGRRGRRSSTSWCRCGSSSSTQRPIGVNEDFFELGGHSLLAVRMLAEIAPPPRPPRAPLLAVRVLHDRVARRSASAPSSSRTTEPPLIVLQADGRRHAAGLRARRRPRRGLVLPPPRAIDRPRRAALRAPDARRGATTERCGPSRRWPRVTWPSCARCARTAPIGSAASASAGSSRSRWRASFVTAVRRSSG